MHKKWSELQGTPWSGENRAACFTEEEYRKTPFQVIRVKMHEGNSKLVSFWSKLRNVGQVRRAKWRIELSSMFVSCKTGVLIFLCFLWIIIHLNQVHAISLYPWNTHTFTLFTLLFFIFLHITRYSFDPWIANDNWGRSNLFIYLFIYSYWFNLITLEIKQKWRNITKCK